METETVETVHETVQTLAVPGEEPIIQTETITDRQEVPVPQPSLTREEIAQIFREERQRERDEEAAALAAAQEEENRIASLRDEAEDQMDGSDTVLVTAPSTMKPTRRSFKRK